MLLLDILVLVLILRLTGKSRTAGKMRTYRAILTVLTVFNALAAVALMVSDQRDWAVIGVEAAALVIDVIGFIQLKKISVMPEQTVPQTESNQRALQAEETASVEDSPEPAPREVFRKVREPGAAAKRFLLFILMVILPAIVLTIIAFAIGDGSMAILLPALGIVAVLFVVFLVIRHHQINKDRRLFVAARAGGIRDPLDSEADFEKLKVLAKSLRGFDRYKDWQLRSLYYYGACKIDREAARDAEKKQLALRKSDLTEKKEYEQFAGLTGREKRYAAMKPRQKELDKSGFGMLSSAKSLTADKRERSVGLAGGIAEGIGGIGAGIAAAADTALENERIRQWNEATRESRKAERKQYESVAMDTLGSAGALLRAIDATQAALLGEPLTQSAAGALYSISVEQAEATPGESLRLTVRARGSGSPMELMGKPAVLDGAFTLLVMENGQKVDSCLLVLPPEGLRADGEKVLKGMCVNRAYDAERLVGLQYEIVPLHLWLIEALPRDIESGVERAFK